MYVWFDGFAEGCVVFRILLDLLVLMRRCGSLIGSQWGHIIRSQTRSNIGSENIENFGGAGVSQMVVLSLGVL